MIGRLGGAVRLVPCLYSGNGWEGGLATLIQLVQTATSSFITTPSPLEVGMYPPSYVAVCTSASSGLDGGYLSMHKPKDASTL
jgi:hypothetical protein